MKNSRNDTLDIFKLFASYMVVFIHVFFYGNLSVLTDALARFAVPLFFATTGFYSYKITPEKIKKRVVYLLRLLIFAVLVCVSFDILQYLLNRDFNGIIHYFSQYLVCNNLMNLFLLNVPVHITQLWYILSILYVYLVYYLITILKVNEKIIFVLSIVLLLVHIGLGEGLSVFGIVVPIQYVRNFALMGFPFFGIGLFASKYRNKLENAPSYLIFVFGILGIVETVLSRYFFGKNELYIGSVLILFALFLIFIKFSDVKYPKFIVAISGCSTFVYIFHMIVSHCLYKVYAKLGIDLSVPLQLMHPIMVCFFSTILAYALKNVDKKLHGN